MAVATGLQAEQREPSMHDGLGNARVSSQGTNAPMGTVSSADTSQLHSHNPQVASDK